jgi:adenosylhomocysteinase
MREDGRMSSSDLAAAGAARLTWIRSRMPLLAETRDRFAAELPFAGTTIGVSLHTEPKTAVLLETLAAGGADIVGTGNHGSTQDDIVAFLNEQGMRIVGRRDDPLEQHHRNVETVLEARPDILLDNGADLAAGALRHGFVSDVRGGTEETTSGSATSSQGGSRSRSSSSTTAPSRRSARTCTRWGSPPSRASSASPT